jgi:hypothetical protein
MMLSGLLLPEEELLLLNDYWSPKLERMLLPSAVFFFACP